MKYFSSCEEILVFNWTLVTLFSFARWTKVVALQRKPTFFPAYVDIFLLLYNPGGIPVLQIPQSLVIGLLCALQYMAIVDLAKGKAATMIG